MRSIKSIGSAVTAALVLAAPVSAATWDPQNTVVHGHGSLTLHTGSAQITCTVTLNLKATGDLARTTNAAGALAGPTFSSCSNNLFGGTTHVTSSAAWNETATSTTSVDLSGGNAVFNLGSGSCVITASGISVPGNTWSNAVHSLTTSSATAFPITRHGFCPLTAGTATLTGFVVFPAGVIIT